MRPRVVGASSGGGILSWGVGRPRGGGIHFSQTGQETCRMVGGVGRHRELFKAVGSPENLLEWPKRFSVPQK